MKNDFDKIDSFMYHSCC